MAGKRKTKDGRVLKPGERQKENGTFEYRFTDEQHKRRSIYAKTLEELRRMEVSTRRDMADGIDYAAGNISVAELIHLYMRIHTKLGINSKRSYSSVVRRIENSALGNKRVKDVKKTEAQLFYIGLHDSGLKRNTIDGYHSVLRPAFEMAVDDDMIRKNPFRFYVSDILDDDSEKRYALTWEQQEDYLQLMRDYGNPNYYNDIVILLGTGLRVSELYGLTKKDVDFERRCIDVTHQLCRTAEKPYFVKSPKTASGVRSVPMTGAVYDAFIEVLENRSPKVEKIVDGYAGFLFLDQYGMPKVGMHLQNYMRHMQPKANELFGRAFPRVTPHVLRHTFCTNMQRAGIDVKSLQYLMGHSKADITLDVYSHVDFESVEKAFFRAVSG